MRDKKIVNTNHWKEYAHPAAIKLHDDLVSIYTHIREKYQKEIDNAFDRISRQIGFVVTTSVPVTLEVGEGGIIKSFTIGMTNLKDTIFEKELSAVLEPSQESMTGVSSGNYNIHLLWFEALKLKLQTVGLRPPWNHMEMIPLAQMESLFDPRIEITSEEAIVMSAIDIVYPELKLMDRAAASREAFRKAGH
jgi:hypothetical protein